MAIFEGDWTCSHLKDVYPHLSRLDLEYTWCTSDMHRRKTIFIFSDIITSTFFIAIQTFSNVTAIHLTADVLQFLAFVPHEKDTNGKRMAR